VTALGGETMGTVWSAKIVAARGDAAAGIRAVLDRIVAQMSQWEAGSDLSRFNRAPVGGWTALPTDFARVLAEGLRIAALTGGAFEPAMGALSDLWGFGPAGPRTAPPDAGEVAAALPPRGAVDYDPASRSARRTAPVRLDFSGIAKGYAVDAVAAWLREAGHRDFLVEIGGELTGAGIRPDGQPWWVDVEMAPGAAHPPIRVALHGLSIATSGNYRRRFAYGGQHYAHTIDPRTGWPIDNGVASVTVLHPSCMTADAWATALTVLGPEGMPLAEREGLAVHMATRDREWLTPALAAML
jgi:FAD:protein FMN transferase